MLLLQHPSRSPPQVQVRVSFLHVSLIFQILTHWQFLSTAAANAPLNPPSVPPATILAPRNARASASPVHSRGAPSPSRPSSASVPCGSCLSCVVDEICRRCFQAKHVVVHGDAGPLLSLGHAPPPFLHCIFVTFGQVRRRRRVQRLPAPQLQPAASMDRLGGDGRRRIRRDLIGDGGSSFRLLNLFRFSDMSCLFILSSKNVCFIFVAINYCRLRTDGIQLEMSIGAAHSN